MKKFLFIILFIPLIGFTQENQIILSGNYGTTMYNSTEVLGGIQYELGITDRISLNYGLRLGYNGDRGVVFQSTMGSFGGTVLFVMGLGEDDDYLTAGLLGWVLPDGVTFTFPVNESTKICPYINILTLEYSSHGILPYLECGIKLKQYMKDNMFIGINLGISTDYERYSLTNFFGGSVGFVVN